MGGRSAGGTDLSPADCAPTADGTASRRRVGRIMIYRMLQQWEWDEMIGESWRDSHAHQKVQFRQSSTSSTDACFRDGAESNASIRSANSFPPPPPPPVPWPVPIAHVPGVAARRKLQRRKTGRTSFSRASVFISRLHSSAAARGPKNNHSPERMSALGRRALTK